MCCRVVAYFIALLNHWLLSPSGGVSIVVLVALLSPIVIVVLDGVALVGFYIVEGLVALLSPIVIMVLDGVALGGFYIVEGHCLVIARVEIGAGLGCLEGVVGIVVGGELEGLVAIVVVVWRGLVTIVGIFPVAIVGIVVINAHYVVAVESRANLA